MAFLKNVARQLPNWAASLATFGATAGAALVYFTEWRVVTENIPLYNLKYKQD